VTLPPPLAIVQARMNSTRLPGKVLMDLGGKPLIAWAVEESIAEFGRSNVVVATTRDPGNAPIVAWCAAHDVQCFAWDGPEEDVLGRFLECALRYRWRGDAVVLRVTPDDWNKQGTWMRGVANGIRHPVELSGEAFTLAMLRECAAKCRDARHREHITYALFGDHSAPPAPPGPWTIDTMEDLEAARALIAARSSLGAGARR
jgi:spore coat polysaccharide biosynthesis protein SpsF